MVAVVHGLTDAGIDDEARKRLGADLPPEAQLALMGVMPQPLEPRLKM